jgi:hypothetical protein
MEHQPPPLLAVREERVERGGAHEREREAAVRLEK